MAEGFWDAIGISSVSFANCSEKLIRKMFTQNECFGRPEEEALTIAAVDDLIEASTTASESFSFFDALNRTCPASLLHHKVVDPCVVPGLFMRC